MFLTTEKEILVMVTVRSILLILLKVKLQTLEYRRRWWNPLLDKQLDFGYSQKLVERILNKSTAGEDLSKLGAIKSTDNRPTDHQPNDHRPLTH